MRCFYKIDSKANNRIPTCSKAKANVTDWVKKKAVSIIANGSVVHAEILTLSGDKKVITTQAGAIKTWGTIDSAAKWLKTIGLGTIKLEVGKWLPNQKGLLL